MPPEELLFAAVCTALACALIWGMRKFQQRRFQSILTVGATVKVSRDEKNYHGFLGFDGCIGIISHASSDIIRVKIQGTEWTFAGEAQELLYPTNECPTA